MNGTMLVGGKVVTVITGNGHLMSLLWAQLHMQHIHHVHYLQFTYQMNY